MPFLSQNPEGPCRSMVTSPFMC